MEGNKNAMYEQAGRNRGWQVVSEEVPMKAPMKAPNVPEMFVSPVIPPIPAPIPAPPVVVAPILTPTHITPVVITPKAEASAKGCQTLAMAYVEMQKWQETYESEQGFHRGTLFTELDLPFVGEGACKHG